MFSDDNRELAYNLIEGAPGFITYTNNHWKVIEISSNRILNHTDYSTIVAVAIDYRHHDDFNQLSNIAKSRKDINELVETI